ncbi:SPRY domain-containing protein 7-like isoform X1 [Pomacea canaliculata]|uniref:SPRY domain-containing protein 7-like isoform X1 n=1 Tax=Pomacea canaliculata TaxID=400727 RepID=UPI000D73A18A|nr:SPRY domain-containing protein 7-like isoform X1 [Pomacea canaliculata]
MDNMASYIFCFRCCGNGTFGGGHVQLKEIPVVKLDTTHVGNDVVIVKNGRRICGTGAALANAPIAQNKAYFEVKVQCTGTWGVGLASRKCDINAVPLGRDMESWVLRQDGTLFHNGEQKGKLTEYPQEGDILGITYDHIEMNFFLNGSPLSTPFAGIKGTVYPAFYVDNGAVLDVQFDKFYHQPPDGYDSIMIEQSLL